MDRDLLWRAYVQALTEAGRDSLRRRQREGAQKGEKQEWLDQMVACLDGPDWEEGLDRFMDVWTHWPDGKETPPAGGQAVPPPMAVGQAAAAERIQALPVPAVLTLGPGVSEAPEPDRPWGPLPGRERPGAFPVNALPSLGMQMAMTVADNVQVSRGMASCMVLGALSAAAVGRVSVQTALDYAEPCHLFVVVGANPSERKSGCMSRVFEPLHRYEQEENRRRAPAVRHYEETREMLEDHLARAKKAGDRGEMADLVDQLNGMEEVKPYELILTDATPEALCRAMARNGGRMAVVSSEGQFFNILAGSYSTNGAANVDVVLKGYSGEPVKVERIGRTGDRIGRACLSLCLAVQPGLLSSFLNDQTLAGRGMASRFLVATPISLVGDRDDEGVPLNMAAVDRFGMRIQTLLQAKDPVTLTFSPEARAAYKAWFREVEGQLKPGGEMSSLGEGWGGKLCGNTARIAGLLALLEGDRTVIGGETMQGAIRIARWFREQALTMMGGEADLSSAGNEALEWLVRRGEAKVSEARVREGLRKKKTFNRMDVVDGALLELETAGFIRRAKPPRREGAGRPEGPQLLLHPGLLRGRNSGA